MVYGLYEEEMYLQAYALEQETASTSEQSIAEDAEMWRSNLVNSNNFSDFSFILFVLDTLKKPPDKEF